MTPSFSLKSFLYFLVPLSMLTQAYAGVPLWTFTPLTPTSLTHAAGEVTTIQYQIINQSHRPTAPIV